MAAILWIDEDFDKNTFAEVNNVASPLAVNMGSWCGQAIAGAGGTSPVDFLQLDNTLAHLGILRVPTGATNGNSSMLFLGRDSQAGGVSASEAMVPLSALIKLEAYVRVPTITTVNVRIGLGQNIDSSVFGTDAFALDFNASTNPNWVGVTRAASTQTLSDTGVPLVAGNWYKLTLRRWTAANANMFPLELSAIGTPGSFSFYINDVSVRPSGISPPGFSIHTTNIPTANMVLGARVATQAASARNLDIDRISVWIDDAAMVT